MIRPTIASDIPGILALAVTSGLFPVEATDEVENVLKSSLNGDLGPDHCWLTVDKRGPIGVAYYAPERMTDGTWNMYMIAISPDYQRTGLGGQLVQYVEKDLTQRGARILLVETSSLATFERTRAFYRKCGYTEEARIREFYKAGEDKVVFRKALVKNESDKEMPFTSSTGTLSR